MRHINFSANNQAGGSIHQLLRKVAHRSEVFCDVLAHRAVTARSASDKDAVFILQRHGKTVDFRLHNIAMLVRQDSIHTLAESMQLFKTKHILQALKRNLMRYLRKGIQRITADMLCR